MQIFAAHTAGALDMVEKLEQFPGNDCLQRGGMGLKLKWTRATQHPCLGQGLAQLNPTDSALADRRLRHSQVFC